MVYLPTFGGYVSWVLLRSHCQTPTQTPIQTQTTMGSVVIFRAVHIAQTPTQTQITIEPNASVSVSASMSVSVSCSVNTSLSRRLMEQIFFQMLNPDYAVKFAFANELPFEKIAAQVLFFLILTKHDFT